MNINLSDILFLIFNITVLCVFFIVIGVSIEKWLVNNGYARDATKFVIFAAIFGLLLRQIWFSSVSWLVCAPVIIIAMVFGANRGDLWTTMQKGKWWWKN